MPRYVLAGLTGVGKTLFLREQPHMIDLEGLAHHRGSAFGRHIEPQPRQIAFENALAYALIHYLHAGHPYLLFEDEGRKIGVLRLPEGIHRGLYQGAQRIVLEVPLEERVDNTLQEYVIEAQARWLAHDPGNGFTGWQNSILDSMNRIRKRLGGERHRELIKRFELALRAQHLTGETEAHREWIGFLLTEYYDPMYHYQMQRSELPVAFRGDAAAVRDWLAQR
ncbi:MAG: hypothetical protein D6717_03090 [Gammaproteobacteria bacterium]|nr:MAG: hypothetical protein D6717_03090 [Gammaproteobacteria bacterium]